MVISPLSFCKFFEIHGSKFKPYPIRDLGEDTVVAVLYNSDCTTLKRFHRESDGEIHLIPENDSMKPIVLKGEQLNVLKIQGVATMVMKDLDS